MSSDKASPKTSELPDSVLRAHEGIGHQNTFEEVGVSFVTGGGRSDASPFGPIWSSTLSAPRQRPFKEHSLWPEKRLGDFRREQNRNDHGCFLEEGRCPQNEFTGNLTRENVAVLFVDHQVGLYRGGMTLPSLNLIRRFLGCP